jgi:hypothetical protein
MDELDLKLNQLALEAQRHYRADAKSKNYRRKALSELMVLMFPKMSQDLSAYPLQREARQRLANVKSKFYQENYQLTDRFNECFQEALQESLLEICHKIDIYNRWIDFYSFKAWKEVCLVVAIGEDSFSLQHPSWLSFVKKTNKFLEKQKNKVGANSLTILALGSIYEEFTAKLEHSLTSNDRDLDDLWEEFCFNLSSLGDRKLSVWQWFKFYLDKRFLDKKKEYLNIIKNKDGTISVIASLDAPVYENEFDGGDTPRLSDILPFPENDEYQSLSQVIQIIKEDPDKIFTKKYVDKFVDINFQSLAILQSKGLNWKQIVNYFGNRVVTGTLSPFMNKPFYGCIDYFRPILIEYLQADLAISSDMLKKIEDDLDGNFGKSRMRTSQMSFRDAVIQRNSSDSWRNLALKLGLIPSDLILDYLTCLQKLALFHKDPVFWKKSETTNQ